MALHRNLAHVALLTALMAPLAPALAADKTVVIASRVSFNTLDPHMSASVGSDLSVLSHIYPSLVIRDSSLKLQPALAKSWQAVDATTWRFELVPGAEFSNGEKLDAATVKWNLDRVRDPKVNARIKAWFDLIADVRVVSPTTVEIRTSSAYPALADQLSMFFLLPPNWAASHNLATQTMSGGPYELQENVPGDHISLRRNNRYWGSKPAFDRVVFRIIPESASRIAALEAGEVDLIAGIPTQEIARINKTAKARAGSIPSIRSVFIKFNTLKPPLDNKEVRQALNYAVDKDAIVKSIFGGQARVSPGQVLDPSYFGFNPALKAYPYDPGKAKALIRQSGIKSGQTIELDVPTNTYLQGEEVAQVVAGQIEELGFKVRIREMDFGTFMNKYLKSKDLAQTSVLGQAWPTIDADGLLTMFAPGNIYAYWNNAEFGALLDSARSTTDVTRRRALYQPATHLMREEAPVLFLYQQPATYGVSNKVTWQARGDDWLRAMDLKPR